MVDFLMKICIGILVAFLNVVLSYVLVVPVTILLIIIPGLNTLTNSLFCNKKDITGLSCAGGIIVVNFVIISAVEIIYIVWKKSKVA